MRIKRKVQDLVKKINKKKAVPYLLLLFVVSLSIAYSAFGTELNIGKFLADVRLEKDIRITGLRTEAQSDNPCSLEDVDSDGVADVGEIITCGTENFYVVPDHDNAEDGTISMLAVTRVNVTGTGNIVQVSNSSSGNITYSNSAYWAGTQDTYPAFVFDNNSNLYSYAEAYKTNLNALGLKEIEVTLMSENQLLELGYTSNVSSGVDNSVPEWAYSITYWTGSAYSDSQMLIVASNGWTNKWDYTNSGGPGFRPVVIVPESQIYIPTDATTQYEDYNVSSINLGVTLPQETSIATYLVEVTNIEGMEAGILEITGLPDNLEYSFRNYNLEEKICDDTGKCNLGASKEIELTIKYKEGSYDSGKTNFDLNLNFNFQPFYTVIYTDIATPSCEYTKDSNGNEMVTCGTESFYVMEKTEDTITMLSKYILNVGDNVDSTQTEGIQLNALDSYTGYQSYSGGVPFSTSNYWVNRGYSPAGNSDYLYVYDSNSNLYQYVNTYETYLKDNGVSSASASIMSYEQAMDLGCNIDLGEYGSMGCGNAPSWVYSTTYWLGSSYDYANNTWSQIFYLISDGLIGIKSYDSTEAPITGVRPVVTISRTEVEGLAFPEEVMGESTLRVNFGENAPGGVIVKIGGKEISNYTYENGLLTIPNVNGNVEIVKLLLPAGYREVVYIESTGTQYIDTNFIPNQDTRVVIDYQYMEIIDSFLIGSRKDVYGYAYTINIGNSAKSSVTSYGFSGNLQYGTPDLNRHVIDKNKNLFYVDEVLLLTLSTQTFTAPGTLEIFAAYHGSTKGYLPSKTKLYSLKIYDNGELVRNFVPCHRTTDDTIGLYDIVGNKFYTNAGTGTFLRGDYI